MLTQTLAPYIPALLTFVIAAVAAYLTYLQHETNALRLKHELFERRFKVYDSFRSFISAVMREGKTSNEACLSFIRETNQAEFLFGPEIPEYLVRSDREVNSVERLQVDERLRASAENTELLKWFGNQYDVARRLFGTYLNLTRLR